MFCYVQKIVLDYIFESLYGLDDEGILIKEPGRISGQSPEAGLQESD